MTNFHTTPLFLRLQIYINKVACGSEHTILLSEKGNIYAMGSNKHGQIGLVVFAQQGPNIAKRGTPTLVQHTKQNKASEIAAGNDHCLIFCSTLR